MKKKVYVCLSADILHQGHINILKKASKLGEVIVGLMTDKAINNYKKIPFLNYSQREVVLKNLNMIKEVIPQNTMDYRKNLRKLKPHYVVHGDDWKSGTLKKNRIQVINELKKWSGKLVEYPYTKNISSTDIKENILNSPSFNTNRTSLLKRLIKVKKFVRIIESHSPLAGLIIENTTIKKGNNYLEYDGMWSSSLTESLLRGKPDNQSVELSTRINALNEIIRSLNNGVLDKSFPVPWEHYRNTLLLTNEAGLNKIPTRIYTIIDVKTWDRSKYESQRDI